MIHQNALVSDGIHIIQSWEPANAAALAALTVTASDIGKVARQVDTGNFYVLKSVAPIVWFLFASDPPIFAVGNVGGQNITPAFTFIKIAFANVEVDNKNAWSVANSRWTPGVAGWYLFNGKVSSGGFTGNTALALYKNGVDVREGQQPNSNTFAILFNSLIHLSATDYVELFVYSSNVVALNNGCQFQGQLVRAD
jgi:hypothetical protein